VWAIVAFAVSNDLYSPRAANLFASETGAAAILTWVNCGLGRRFAWGLGDGAGCRIRTRDLRFTKALLYQLS
jgi:hypothetical protein